MGGKAPYKGWSLPFHNGHFPNHGLEPVVSWSNKCHVGPPAEVLRPPGVVMSFMIHWLPLSIRASCLPCQSVLLYLSLRLVGLQTGLHVVPEVFLPSSALCVYVSSAMNATYSYLLWKCLLFFQKTAVILELCLFSITVTNCPRLRGLLSAFVTSWLLGS
jgi:hypothetical protein